MIDTVPVQMWFLTDTTTYGRVNQHHADFMGLPKKDIEFKKLDEFLPLDIANACIQSNQEVFNTKETVDSEEWLCDINGDRRLIKISKTPRLDQHGEIEYIVCFGIDITNQRKEEVLLAQSEVNFRSYIEALADIVLVGNPDGQIIYSNPAASAKLGFSIDEFRAMRIIDLHPEFMRKEAASIFSAMLSGKRDTCPLPLISKDHAIIPVETRVWFGKWNDMDCVFGLSKDLSKEQEALQKFDRFFRTNPALMAVNKMPEYTFVNVNDAFLNALGYTEDEILGRTSAELGLFVDREEQQRVADMLAEYGRIIDAELKVKTKHGDVRYGLFSGDIIENQGSKYFLTVMLDITERKKAEAERQKTIHELHNALAEIKTLRGIVPICAQCKQIRDDKGYWSQVEAYIARHTEVKFSHSICPNCMQTLYPEFYKSDDGSD